MANKNEGTEGVVIGDLIAVKKRYTDRETNKTREYYGYEVHFENGAVVRFSPLPNDRSLLDFAIQDYLE